MNHRVCLGERPEGGLVGLDEPTFLLTLRFSFSPEEKPKADPVLKSPSPALRPEPSGERKDPAGLAAESPASTETSSPELPLPALPSPATGLAAAAPSKPLFATDLGDRRELASPKLEAPLLPSVAPCVETPDGPPGDESEAEACREPRRGVRSESQVTASANLVHELNGVSDRVAVTDGLVEQELQEGGAPVAELETPEAAQAEVEDVPPPAAPVVLSATPSPSPSPPPSPPLSAAAAVTTASPSPPPPPLAQPGALQGDSEGEAITRTVLSEDVPEALGREEQEAEGCPEENADSHEGLNARKGPGPGEWPLCQAAAAEWVSGSQTRQEMGWGC